MCGCVGVRGAVLLIKVLYVSIYTLMNSSSTNIMETTTLYCIGVCMCLCVCMCAYASYFIFECLHSTIKCALELLLPCLLRLKPHLGRRTLAWLLLGIQYVGLVHSLHSHNFEVCSCRPGNAHLDGVQGVAGDNQAYSTDPSSYQALERPRFLVGLALRRLAATSTSGRIFSTRSRHRRLYAKLEHVLM